MPRTVSSASVPPGSRTARPPVVSADTRASGQRPVGVQPTGRATELEAERRDRNGEVDIKVEDLASEREREPAAAMEAEIERLRALVEEKDRHARAASVRARLAEEELERAKHRIRKDARKDAEQRTRGFLRSFLDVLDDLDRAIAAAHKSEDDSAVLRGVELVRKRFIDTLAHQQVTHQPALGERFDPERHQAMSMVPVDDKARDGVIVGVVREGYAIGAETLRPAAVAVGRYAGPDPTDN